MSYCMYLRKSRADLEAEARGEGETLARHQAELERAAKRLGIQAEQAYREIVSGESIAARPAMQRLLCEVEQGLWEGVLVTEIERLARGDSIDQGIVAQAFRCSGTKIITPLKTFDPANEFDEEYFEFGLFMSRREYKSINRRLQRGRAASVLEGKYVGNVAPYGYERVKLQGEKGWTLRPLPQEADAVRLAFSLRAGGLLGPGKIAARLNALGAPTRSGAPWTAGTVRELLANPVYMGKLRWNRRPAVKASSQGQVIKTRPRKSDFLLADGLHEPLVEEALFTRAQTESKAAPIRAKPDAGIKNPLAGLLVCGRCGHTMVRRPYRNGRPDGLVCPTPGCPNVGADLPLVLSRLKEALRDRLESQPLPEQAPAPPGGSPDSYSRALLERELRSLAQQLERAHDLLEQGVYSPETFSARAAALSGRQSRAQAALEAAAQGPDRDRGAEDPAPAQNLMEAWERMPGPEPLNRFLKTLLERVVYTKDSGGRWDAGALDSFRLDIFLRLP